MPPFHTRERQNMYDTFTTDDVRRHWQLAARWAREYSERAKVARQASKRGAYLAAAGKWHDERHAAAEELAKRLEATVAKLATANG